MIKAELPPRVISLAEAAGGAISARLNHWRNATGEKMRQFYAEKVMEVATPDMWLAYYQGINGRKGGQVGGKISKGGGRPRSENPSPAALAKRLERERKAGQEK